MAAKRAGGVFIVAAKRTAFGTFGGKLKGFTATDLAVESSRAAIAAAKVRSARSRPPARPPRAGDSGSLAGAGALAALCGL